MSATRNPPKCYSADGIPIYYSTELHSKRKKLLDASDTAAPPDTPIYRIKLTLRLPKKHKRTGTLEYGKIIFEQVCESPYGRDCTSEQLEEFIATQTPHFWKTAFNSIEPDVLINMFDPAKGLPLLIAWSANRLLLSKQKDWSDGTLKKKDYIISQLLNFGWGNIPIGSLTVEHCGATLMEHLSSASHKNATTLLNQIADYERLQKRLSTDTVPLKRPLRGKHSRSQPTTYVRQHIRANTLTQKQIATIISDACKHNLEKFSNQNYLVLLLVAVMSIPVEELCYIRLSDITLGRDDLPLSIHIKGTCQLKGKNVFGEEYLEPSPQNRILPIPYKLALILLPILKKWRAGLSDKALSSRYFFHHAKNTSRGCNPQSLTKWINHHYKNKLKTHRFLDGNCKVIPASVATTPYRMLLATGKSSFRCNGFEDDEHTYYFGHSPKSMAAKTYCDFANDGERWRLSQIMDMRLPAPPALHAPYSTTMSIKNPPSRKKYVFLSSSDSTSLLLQLDFPPSESLDHPYQIQIAARGGYSMSATFIPPKKAK